MIPPAFAELESFLLGAMLAALPAVATGFA